MEALGLAGERLMLRFADGNGTSSNMFYSRVQSAEALAGCQHPSLREMIGIENQGGSSEILALVNQLNVHLEQEPKYQPRISGLKVIESAPESGIRMTVRLREYEVKDLLSLSQFFGFRTDAFVLAVSLLDRFLGLIKVQPKHLCCVGLCCFYLAVRATEEEHSVPLASDLIRISQCRFTISDMMRMENIVLEKLRWRVRGPTALDFLRLYHKLIMNCSSTERRMMLNFEQLESQLKACNCRFVFSKTKGSILALSIIALEVQTQKLYELTETIESLQQHSEINDHDLFYWQDLVAECLAEYSSSSCSRPSSKRLMWIVSRRTSRRLHSYHQITPLPTIPETATCTERGNGNSLILRVRFHYHTRRLSITLLLSPTSSLKNRSAVRCRKILEVD